MKKHRIFLILLSLSLILAGCGGQGLKAPSAPSETTQAQIQAPETTGETTIETTMEATAPALDPIPIYQEALETLRTQGIFPDGEVCGDYSGFGTMEDNAFAIFDVDGDEKLELILIFHTAPMAGMMEAIYGLDEEGNFLLEMQAFPGPQYYEGGMILAPWSHNHTLGYAWPYSLLAWDEETDSYTWVYQVTSWTKAVANPDPRTGEPFPEEKDDGSGEVYYVVSADGTTSVFSTQEFFQWEEDHIPKKTLDISFQKLTQENIAALGS